MKTTVIIDSKTRNVLKQIGTKGQTYDQIITELLALRTNNKDMGTE
ncbi:MAG: hypothetical protein WBF33_24385 [Candidatus Nitrosopolaris sp.]